MTGFAGTESTAGEKGFRREMPVYGSGAGKRCPHLYPGNPAVRHRPGTGRGYLKPPYQQDSGGRGEKGWRGEVSGNQNHL